MISDRLATDLGIYSLEKPEVLLVETLRNDPGMFGAGSRRFHLKVQEIYRKKDHAGKSILFLPLNLAQRILGTNEQFNEVEVRTFDLNSSLKLADQFKANKPVTWLDRQAALFYSLKLERIAMAICLSFIVLVASFTIFSSIGMMAMEKMRELAILRGLGLSRKALEGLLRNIGLLLGGVGVSCGMILGLFLTLLLKETQIVPLPDLYVDRSLPVVLSWQYFFGVGVLGFLLVYVASLIPAKVAARQEILEQFRSMR
jgi:lipoprotein-releasing system permease protein